MENGMTTDKWKRSVDDYVSAARTLCLSMVAKGFDPAYPVPIDPNGELLGGAHRVACALALGIEEIPVTWEPRYCWAPAWDSIWFEQEGMKLKDIDRLYEDWDRMRK